MFYLLKPERENNTKLGECVHSAGSLHQTKTVQYHNQYAIFVKMN